MKIFRKFTLRRSRGRKRRRAVESRRSVCVVLSLSCHLSTGACVTPRDARLKACTSDTRRGGTYRRLACSQFVWNPLCILSHTRLSQWQRGLTHWTRGRALIGQHPRGPSVTRCSISPAGTNNKAERGAAAAAAAAGPGCEVIRRGCGGVGGWGESEGGLDVCFQLCSVLVKNVTVLGV